MGPPVLECFFVWVGGFLPVVFCKMVGMIFCEKVGIVFFQGAWNPKQQFFSECLMKQPFSM